MKREREKIIELFTQLGDRLANFGKEPHSQNVIKEAVEANGWFLPQEIVAAVEAIRLNMLQREQLTSWLEQYPLLENFQQNEPKSKLLESSEQNELLKVGESKAENGKKNVGVIMAGNIPLVGFFDLLCVLAAGDNCYIKPSSKDSILVEYIVSQLRDIEPSIGIKPFEPSKIDALIATGSDNTNRYFRTLYANVPSLLRGSRSSVAILTGEESKEQLRRLSTDIFTFSGLGCRNVSHLLVPKGYDFAPLMEALSHYKEVNPKLKNNFQQRRALLTMEGGEFLEGAFYIVRQDSEASHHLSELTYEHYPTLSVVAEWLEANESELQCALYDPLLTVGLRFSRAVEFGESQSPTLTDYADDIDTMEFLLSL